MEQLLKDLNARRDRARLLMFSCLILYIPALVLLFKGNAAAGAAASVLGFGVYLFVAKREEKRYAAAVAEANALRGVAAPLENAEYAARSEMFAKDSLPVHVSPADAERISKPLCCHAVAGTYDSRAVELCEMTFGYQYADKKSAWRFFSGTAARLALAPREGDEALLLSPNLFDGSFTAVDYEKKGWHKGTCPSWSMKQDGTLFTRGEGEPSPEWLKALAEDFRAVRGTNGLCALYVGRDTAEVFLRSRFYAQSAKVAMKPDEAMITSNGFAARDALLALAQRLSAEAKA